METVRWCEGGGDARNDSERRGRGIDHERNWEREEDSAREERREEGGRMSAKKAIYIRQKTVPLALTATSWHHHPLRVCLSKHTRVNHRRYSGCMAISFKSTNTRAVRTWRGMKYINLFFDCSLLFYERKNLSAHRHMRIGFELWNVWNLITQLHNDSAIGHLERPLAVRPGHGCEKGWGSLTSPAQSSQECLHTWRYYTFHWSKSCFIHLKEKSVVYLL